MFNMTPPVPSSLDFLYALGQESPLLPSTPSLLSWCSTIAQAPNQEDLWNIVPNKPFFSSSLCQGYCHRDIKEFPHHWATPQIKVMGKGPTTGLPYQVLQSDALESKS